MTRKADETNELEDGVGGTAGGCNERACHPTDPHCEWPECHRVAVIPSTSSMREGVEAGRIAVRDKWQDGCVRNCTVERSDSLYSCTCQAMAALIVNALPRALLQSERGEWQPIKTAPDTPGTEANPWGEPIPMDLYGQRIGVCAGSIHRWPGQPPTARIPHLHGEAITEWGVTHFRPRPSPPSLKD